MPPTNHAAGVLFFLLSYVVLFTSPAIATRQLDGRTSATPILNAGGMPGSHVAIDPDHVIIPTELAGPDQGWRPLKLHGGTVTCIAVSPVNPDHMAVGSSTYYHSARVHISHDGGKTWSIPQWSFSWGDVRPINDLEFGPDGRLYVAAYRTLVRSDANMTTWESLPVAAGNPDIRFIYFHEVSINPDNPAEIWAGTGQTFGFHAPVPRLMRSTDDGRHWTDITPAIEPSGGITGIAFNPSATGRVVVTTNGFVNEVLGEVWRTLDGGATWTKGLGYSGLINDVAHDGSRFFICGGMDSGTAAEENVGVYMSNTDGLIWVAQHTPLWPSRLVYDLAAEPGQPGVLLAATPLGIFRKSGNSWSFNVGPAGYKTYAVAPVPGQAGHLFVGTENFGVLRSTDNGVTFGNSSDGLMLFNVNGVASNPARPSELAAAVQSWDRGGIMTSQDNGESWQREALPDLRFDSIEFGPDGTLYAVAGNRTATLPEGIYRRNGDGTWTHLGPRHGTNNYFYIHRVRVAHHDPNTVFAVGGAQTGFVPIVWRSTDAGVNWSAIYSGSHLPGEAFQFTDIQIVNDGTDQNILVSKNGGGGLVASWDGGASWYTPVGVANEIKSYSVRGTPANPLAFYLGSGVPPLLSEGPCHKTVDGGASWSPLGSALRYEVLEVDRANPNVVYGIHAQASPAVVDRSTDGGNSFHSFDAGLEGGIAPREIASQAGECPTLLLATSAGLFARTIDSVAPQVSLELEPNVLWPPDHKLKTITARVSMSDACDAGPTFALKSIAMSDVNGAPGDVVANIGEGTTTFQLRAERSGKGDRRYLVTYTATDASGNVSEATAVVLVPHDRSGIELADDPAPRGAPAKTELVSIEPNPFNPSTSAMITLAQPGRADLDVYDVRGAHVRSLASGTLPAGAHRIAWDGTDQHGRPAASGVYFFRFVSGARTQTMKALLIK